MPGVQSCLMTCVKIFLVALNLVFLVVGGGMLAVGIWMKVNADAVQYMKILATNPSGPALNIVSWVFIAVGGVLCLVSFLGCCGACCESHMMIYLYVVLLIVIMAAEITAAVLAYIYRNKVDEYLEKTMKAQVKYQYNRPIPYKENATDTLTKAWDLMQSQLRCCGSAGPSDYKNSKWHNQTGRLKGKFVPQTCCLITDEATKISEEERCQNKAKMYMRKNFNYKKDGEIESTLNSVHSKGCKTAVKEWISARMAIIIGIAAGILGLQIVVFILACCLLQYVRRKLEDYEDDY